MSSGSSTELGAIALAAMLSPTTLTFSVLALVLGDRPRRTGLFFYLGALTATLAVGIIAAFVIGDVAASSTSTPKTWVAIVDVVAAALLLIYAVRLIRKPPDPEQTASAIERMGKVTSSPVIAIVGAGAALANPGAFIPLALKAISETDPSAAQYIAEWVGFALISLLPLGLAVIMLFVAPGWTGRTLEAARRWLERRAMTVAAVFIMLLAAALLRNGISGLTS